MEPTDDIRERCIQVFLKCGEFDNYEDLKAVFKISALDIFAEHLQKTSSTNSLVLQTIAFLLPLRLSAGNQPALPIFIRVLKNHRSTDDALYVELDQLYHEISNFLTDKIIVPFVVITMLLEEAKALADETVFKNEDVSLGEIKRYQDFSKILSESGVDNFLPFYGVDREAWKPLTYSDQTIQDIVNETLYHYNEAHRSLENLPVIFPQFRSNEFFSSNKDTRYNIVQDLRSRGGILIIDGISLSTHT